MLTTEAWARARNISVDEHLEPIADYEEPCARSATEIARRALILQGVIAVAYQVESQPVIEWFQEQGLWSDVTNKEQAFLANTQPDDAQQLRRRWQQECLWTLLWMIGKIEALGLPTTFCDTGRIVDEIMPGLGDDVQAFIDSSELRSPGAMLAEDDRTYNLWCYLHVARRRGEDLPGDLLEGVLYERRYAFEWIDGNQEWDDVTCDS